MDKIQIFGNEMVQATMKAGYVAPPGLPVRSNNTYLFTIGDLALFERQLADAQYDLGWDMFEHVPVVYTESTSLSYVTLLFISFYFGFVVAEFYYCCSFIYDDELTRFSSIGEIGVCFGN